MDTAAAADAADAAATAAPSALHGRDAEIGVLTALLEAAGAGASGAVVLRGEPGVGKSALVAHARKLAAGAGFRVLRCIGVEVEAELPFSGLSMLLRPALGGVGELPGPQRDALSAALGLAAGEAPDPVFVGLAVLTLLDAYAGETGAPLLCLVDDAQWLDRPSAQALVFAARRLGAEGIAMLFAARDGEGSFPDPGLPTVRISGLTPADGARLLDVHFPDLRPDVRARVLAEARGNPLALRELPLAFAAEGASAAGGLHTVPLTDRLTLAFHGQVSRLPAATQALLLAAAAEESGDLGVVLRAARALGAGPQDVEPAERADLVHCTADELTFRHPLIRAVVYQRAPLADRLGAHRALADALDAEDQADRRAWHLAAAAAEPDEAVAAALELTADHARERSGVGAAQRAYERAARLTPSADARGRRLLLAAGAALDGGEPDRARDLAREAVRRATGEAPGPDQARSLYIRGAADFAQGAFAAAHPLLLEAAQRALDAGAADCATTTLMRAVHTAWYLGEEAVFDVVARLGALDLPPADHSGPIVRFITAAFAPPAPPRSPGSPGSPADTPAPLLREALAASTGSTAVGRAAGAEELSMACAGALLLGQDADAHDLAVWLTEESRRRGELGSLPPVAFFKAETELFLGRGEDARETAIEGLTIARESGQGQWTSQLESFLALSAALAGDERACREHADRAALADGFGGAMAPGIAWTHWALGLLDLGLGRPDLALERLERLTLPQLRHHISAIRATPDLVEASVRVGSPERAADHFARFEQWARRARQPWGDALVLRCRALLSGGGPFAEAHYEAALDLHARDYRPIEQARTALLFGEWLRRAKRKMEARAQLGMALELFERHGAGGWAQRARVELEAAGGRPVGQQSAPTDDGPAGLLPELTPQELQIARLAAQGLSNRDIAARLFLSPRTVGHHLYKAYPKLGIVSRAELAGIKGIGPA